MAKTETGKTQVSARVPTWIVDGLNEVADDIRPRPKLTQMIELALEDFVRGKGVKPKGKDKG